MLKLIQELAVYEKMPEEVTVDPVHFEESGFGSNPVWWAFVVEEGKVEKVEGVEEYKVEGVEEVEEYKVEGVEEVEEYKVEEVEEYKVEEVEGYKVEGVEEVEGYKVEGVEVVEQYKVEVVENVEAPSRPSTLQPLQLPQPPQPLQPPQLIVAFALYYIRYSTWKGQVMYLEDILVTESMRGKGIGKLLMDRLIEEATEKGFKKITWQVLDWNQQAIDFYKKYNVQFDPTWVNVALEL